MQRTFNFSDKQKKLLQDYDNKYDKKELDVLVTNLLKANKQLKDKDIDLLLITDLIIKFDISLYSLIAALSGFHDSSINKNQDNDTTLSNTNKDDTNRTEEKEEEQQKMNPILAMGNLSK